ncbi:MAG: RraA family protein [Acidobacteria bacterium]|nr:RraA family protein [Acidobacteriota bacterium]
MSFATHLLDGFDWTTPFIADACTALQLPVRSGPPGLKPIVVGLKVAGRVCPAHHAGSVDVFLEAVALASAGDVLVIDNTGRLDEGCIGDLVAGEAHMAGLAGIVVWGAHRDTAAIQSIGIPVWSLGTYPVGPQELRSRSRHALEAATVGRATVTRDEVVFADDDGVVFVSAADSARVIASARDIAAREQAQAARLTQGALLRTQLDLEAYLAKRRDDPDHTFRDHLRARGGAIEI